MSRSVEVPLDKVQEEWYSGYGLKHLKTVANHFGLYRDMYEMMFEPEVTMAISFENDRKVRFGNIIEPSEVSNCVCMCVCVCVCVCVHVRVCVCVCVCVLIVCVCVCFYNFSVLTFTK